MELAWDKEEQDLDSFLERFDLPQIVQIAEGVYESSEETTLSRGQVLNLHALKKTECYQGVTDTGEEIYIPLNSPNKVHVFFDKRLENCNSPDQACAIFSKKKKHVQAEGSDEELEASHFDIDTMQLICIDNQGCEVTFELAQLNKLIVREDYKDVFVAEIRAKEISPPFTVQFTAPHSSSAYLPSGWIQVKKVVTKLAVIATPYNVEFKSILTLPSTLEVTVLAPRQALPNENHPEYRNLRETINREMNLKKVEEKIESYDGIYDDVETEGVSSIPYATTFFVKPAADDGSGGFEEQASENHPRYSNLRENVNKKMNLKRVEEKIESSDEIYDDVETTGVSSIPYSSTFFVTPAADDGSGGFEDQASSKAMPKERPATPPKSTGGLKQRVGRLFSRIFRRKKNTISDSETGQEEDVSPRVYYETLYAPRQLLWDRKTDDLNVKEVRLFLNYLNLGQYGELFEREQVDGKLLKSLTKELLQTHFKMIESHARDLERAARQNWRPAIQN
ncbi:uncharacterized protein LOC114529893 [Dendronephthya gigantea]|uniref:uncharacterized protein LOC114529893 n=1 Tax=Dendronephthya gigantea TaxID=151771 RepID=UPI00106D68B9|nr:uncharacterized protein LOC114529893 [Dendronephthya gigantea]